MFDSLNRFGLPVKYAIVGLIGGIIWLVIAPFFGVDVSSTWLGTLIGIAIGGAVGGYLRQRMGKST